MSKYPGLDKKVFKAYISDTWFKRGDIIYVNGFKARVLHEPKTKKIHSILNVITFGLFKIRYYYKIKIVE